MWRRLLLREEVLCTEGNEHEQMATARVATEDETVAVAAESAAAELVVHEGDGRGAVVHDASQRNSATHGVQHSDERTDERKQQCKQPQRGL